MKTLRRGACGGPSRHSPGALPGIARAGAALLLVGAAGVAATDPVDHCPPLAPPSGPTVRVDSVGGLLAAIGSAAPGITILVADGVYDLDGTSLRIGTPNVTLRSESGSREAVILDGNYATSEIIQITASSVTIADITLREAYDHPIHVMSTSSAPTDGTLIYNVHIMDPGQQAIKINPVDSTHFVDDGVVACSRIELTSAGRPHIRDNCYTGGVDAHAAEGWAVRDNEIEGFWCDAGLSEHAVHFWRASRDTRVERNRLRNNARGVGFGLASDGSGRSYPDAPCPAAGGAYIGHYGGAIENNFIGASDPALFASAYGFDCGICLWQACEATATHNTIHSSDTGATFSSIEWRFSRTVATLTNNLANHTMRERDGATGALAGNVTSADGTWYVDAPAGDLHLQPDAMGAIDQGVATALTADIDADSRPYGPAPDVGADEHVPLPSLSVGDLSVTEGDDGTVMATFTVTLSDSD
ncbi:MAG: hypothetical protein LJF30_12505 [Acidobacteria bacterium]|nr:hypothetical protein [Acidobacteriota bacterium]